MNTDEHGYTRIKNVCLSVSIRVHPWPNLLACGLQCLLKLFGKVFTGFRPEASCFHRQCVVQVVDQLEQAFDVGLDGYQTPVNVGLWQEVRIDTELYLQMRVILACKFGTETD